MKLSLGSTTAAKAVVVIFTLFAMCCTATPLIALTAQNTGTGGELTVAVIAVGAVYLLVVAGLIWLALSVLRGGVRLDGTVVTMQRAFTSTSVDLATVPTVWFDEHQVRREGRTGAVLPLLCTRRPDGKLFRFALATQRSRLPPDELAALAAAIERGHRTGAEAQQATAVAEQLRTWSYRLPG
ncbi:hypothetical protein [Phytomonospora endophytica]|uniref:PH domain-containing protein n=1 Tax=Phytomonospora endophytica TaxID=714109 RepID=A0A841FIZ3_9ACTN|nr:hypothetical protein [Phytomonospora endophytica]MBB6033522.1 hypothetical protein [Phytomonospora endophytica]GIG64961.1 hypothetical protein Pen01_12560 [Phytomonospora endophytica]